MRGLGTLINTAAVVGGGVLGLLAGHRISQSIRTIVVQVIGMATLVLGIESVMDTHNIVFPLVGMAIGLRHAGREGSISLPLAPFLAAGAVPFAAASIPLLH